MTPEQAKVKQWMERAGQECPDKPTIPSLEIRMLRARLIMEEALETVEALGLRVGVPWEWIRAHKLEFIEDGDCNLTSVADGMADLQCVNLGSAVACGIDLEPIFAEVCRSNDTKWWTANEIDYAKYPAYEFRPLDNHLFCATDHGGKVIKSPSYSAAKIEPMIATQRSK
jgi:predicted HAD superfamily Cof-like phosphohydrolase